MNLHVPLFNGFRYILHNAGVFVHNVSYLVLLRCYRIIRASIHVLTRYALIVSLYV